jgi:hypothetical protein
LYGYARVGRGEREEWGSLSPAGREPRIEPHPRVGEVFDIRRFERPSDEGVASGCQLTGWFDFPNGGYRCSVENGVQRVEIKESAPTNGDAGIERHVEVASGEVYRLTARVRLMRATRGIKTRINLAARRADGSQIAEFNDRQDEVTDAPVERSADAHIPRGTDYLTLRVKLHSSQPGDFGEAEIHTMRCERLR